MSNILLVEDENHIAQGIKLNLELAGHTVTICDAGDLGLNYWRHHDVDLLILDLMLPGMDGEKVLEEIRKSDEKFPVLILSAKDEAKSKVKCFNLGTDDYLSKPFDLAEFMLRVERLLKRSSWVAKEVDEIYSFANNRIDFTSFSATGNGQEFSITEQEATLLRLLIENEAKAVTRKEILKNLGYNEESSTRTIDNFIVRFRKYFELDSKKPQHFLSIRSVGYMFKK